VVDEVSFVDQEEIGNGEAEEQRRRSVKQSQTRKHCGKKGKLEVKEHEVFGPRLDTREPAKPEVWKNEHGLNPLMFEIPEHVNRHDQIEHYPENTQRSAVNRLEKIRRPDRPHLTERPPALERFLSTERILDFFWLEHPTSQLW